MGVERRVGFLLLRQYCVGSGGGVLLFVQGRGAAACPTPVLLPRFIPSLRPQGWVRFAILEGP